MSKIYAKKKQFQAQIRRQYINKQFSQMRKMIDIELLTANDLAQVMNVPIPEGHRFSMVQLLQEIQQSLYILPFGQDMIEQKQRPQVFSLEIHVKFWKVFSEQLHLKHCTYQFKVGQVLCNILRKYSYAYIHQSTAYQCNFLNMLELSAPYLPIPIKEEIMIWIAGPQGLRVIDALMEDEQLPFPKCRMFKEVYQVIQLGLKSQFKSQNTNACKTLQIILTKADLEDTFEIYSQFYGIMSHLCGKIQRYWKQEPTRTFNKTALYLLQTFQEAILDYARGSVAYIAALLITSPIEQNYQDGIQIMRILSQVDQRQMILFLLDASQIAQTGIWSKLCHEDFFARHPDRKVRQHYQAIILNILTIGNQKDIEKLCLHFGHRYQDILEMLKEQVQNNQNDPIILLIIMKSFRSIVYYGNQHQLLEVFQQKGLIYLLEKYAQRQDQISEQANIVLEILFNKDPQEKYPV